MADVTPDLGAIYREARLAFIASYSSMSEDLLAKKLPACGLWTPKDLLGHVSGTIDDITNGRIEGAGSDPWTNTQVLASKDLTAEQLIARWNEQAPNVETLLTSSPPAMALIRLVIDSVTHLWDLAGLSGKRPELDEGFEFALTGYASAFGHRIKKNELPAIELSTGSWTYVAGEGDPDFAVEADPVEFFRAFAGRRSERQVLLWDWDGEPRPYIEHISNFGELHHTEVNEAF